MGRGSYGLFFAAALAGGVGSLSVVAMYPWALSLRHPYFLPAISSGIGASAAMPNLLSLIPGLTTSYFMLVLGATVLLAFFAFLALQFIVVPSPSPLTLGEGVTAGEGAMASATSASIQAPTERTPLVPTGENPWPWRDLTPPSTLELAAAVRVQIICEFLLPLMYFTLLGLNPFVCVPFTESALLLFWLIWTQALASSLGRAATAFKSRLPLLSRLSLPMLVGAQLLLLAALSAFIIVGQLKTDILAGAWIAAPLILYALFAFSFGYADTRAYQEAELLTLRLPQGDQAVPRAALLVSGSNQVGAIAGAIAGYFLSSYALAS